MLPRLVLIGTGPTHLLLLEHLARRREPAREAVLVSSVRTEMGPGTLPGLLAGRYRPSEVSVNLERLAHAAGVHITHGEVRSIEVGSRTIRLEDGATLLYNAASVATGPYPSSSRVPGATRHARFVHTLDMAMALVPALESVVREVPDQVVRVAVVGGSPEALEIAMTLRTVLHQVAHRKGVVTLIAAAHAAWKERAVSARLAEAALRRKDISVIMGAEVVVVTNQHLQLSNGARVTFDLLVWAAGDQALDYLSGSGRPVDGAGQVVVDPHLQVVDAPALFAAGEVIIKRHEELKPVAIDPREGARIIGDNLLSVLGGHAPARTYQPGIRVSLAETGGETALLSFGNFGLEGKWLMTLKQWSDRKLMRRLSPPTA